MILYYSYVGHVSKKRKHSISPNSTLNQNMLNTLMQVKQEPGMWSLSELKVC